MLSPRPGGLLEGTQGSLVRLAWNREEGRLCSKAEAFRSPYRTGEVHP
jgi:hypothetical protein